MPTTGSASAIIKDDQGETATKRKKQGNTVHYTTLLLYRHTVQHSEQTQQFPLWQVR